jgi:hypothetical protein
MGRRNNTDQVKADNVTLNQVPFKHFMHELVTVLAVFANCMVIVYLAPSLGFDYLTITTQ